MLNLYWKVAFNFNKGLHFLGEKEAFFCSHMTHTFKYTHQTNILEFLSLSACSVLASSYIAVTELRRSSSTKNDDTIGKMGRLSPTKLNIRPCPELLWNWQITWCKVFKQCPNQALSVWGGGKKGYSVGQSSKA